MLVSSESRPRKPFLGGQDGLGVFFNLVRRFEEHVVTRIDVVLAAVGRVAATNVRSRFVDAAAVVGQQMLAVCKHLNVPVVSIHEDGRLAVHQEPADVVVVLPSCRFRDAEGVVAAALRRAIAAKELAVRQSFPSHWQRK